MFCSSSYVESFFFQNRATVDLIKRMKDNFKFMSLPDGEILNNDVTDILNKNVQLLISKDKL